MSRFPKPLPPLRLPRHAVVVTAPVVETPFLAEPAVTVEVAEEAEKPRRRRAPRARKADAGEDAGETTKAE